MHPSYYNQKYQIIKDELCDMFSMHKEDDKVNRLISKSREGTDTGIVRRTEYKSASEKKGVGVRIGLI